MAVIRGYKYIYNILVGWTVSYAGYFKKFANTLDSVECIGVI